MKQARPLPPLPGPLFAEGGSRRQQILETAAQIFVRKGYRGTSMREIGEAAGVLGGSLYHHIRSKEALFVELHDAALGQASAYIEQAVEGIEDPWERLEATCIAFTRLHLDPASLTLPAMNNFREVPEEVQSRLIERRDAFEDFFRVLVDTLPLPPEIDRSIYRNALLAQLNSVSDWYHPGRRLSPAEIGQQIARIFRHG